LGVSPAGVHNSQKWCIQKLHYWSSSAGETPRGSNANITN
jgi:hypothetical protein